MNESVLALLSRFSKYISGLAIAFGGIVLTGWAFHIQMLKGLMPGQVAVKANTGVCFILLGLGMWLATSGVRNRFTNVLSRLLALLASFIGLLSFLEFWNGWDLGIDQLLFTAGPEDLPGSVRIGLMSPIAAADFFLLGIAVAMVGIKGRWGRVLQNSLPAITAVTTLFGILDFVLAKNTHTHIAPMTALILFLFSFAVLFARADGGLGALLLSRAAGGMLCRRLLPSAFLVPIAIAWLRWRGEQIGLYSDWAGLAIMTVTSGALLAGLTVWTAFVLDRADADRSKATESARNLASIVTCSNDAIIGKTLEGTVISWNPGAEAIYGFTAEEMIGQSVTRIVPPDLLGEFQKFLHGLQSGDTIRHHETERIRKDGKRIPVSISISPLKDEKGEIVGASTITRDVTERRRAEQALADERRRFEAMLDTLPVMICLLRPDYSMAFANRSFQQQFGEPKGRKCYEFCFGKTAPCDFCQSFGVLKEGQALDWEVVTDNGRKIHAFDFPFNDADGSPLVLEMDVDITEQKEAERKIREASRYTRNLIEASLDPLVTISKEGKITDVNEATEKATGVKRDRLIGSDFSDYFTEPEIAREGYGRVFKEGFVRDYPLAIRNHSGSVMDVLYNATVFRGANGEVEGVFAAARDITQRKLAEDELRRVSRYSRSLIEASLDPLVTISREGKITDVNEATERATGVSRARLIGSDFSNYFTEPAKAREGYSRVFAEGLVRDYPLAIRNSSGDVMEVLYNATVFKSASGEVEGVFAAARDITERKKAEEAVRNLNRDLEDRVQQRTAELRESEKRVRHKLDSILSPEGDLGSLELADLLDIPAVQAIAEDFYELAKIPMFILDLRGAALVAVGWQEICMKFHRTHPDACNNCRESDLLLSKGVKAGEFRLYKCKNNMWDVVTPIMVGGQQLGNLFSGQFFFDDEPIDYSAFRAQAKLYGFDEADYIAALDRAPRLSREVVNTGMAFFMKFAQLLSQLSYSGIKLARSLEEIRRVNAELGVSNKELEAFTYSVSHDLRAPLRHISGFSKMLSEEFSASLPPEAQHQIARIQEGTRRMGQLVDDLLNLGRVGRKELSLQVAGLRSIVDEVIASLKPDVGDRQVEWKIGDLPYVECDTALIHQVFHNLLSNSLKFTRPRAHAVIEIGQEQREGASVVYIRDNGVGFSMKYADKLFGVFQRLHRTEDFEGTGVGLATVQRIIQKHGGRIWAEAELDKGAAFYFTLGSGEANAAAPQAASAGKA